MSEALRIVLTCCQNLVLRQFECSLIVSASLLPFPRFLSVKTGNDSLLFYPFYTAFPVIEVASVA